MICFPNAKINLGLHIVSKRPDGYHAIETIFYPVGLKDALEIIPQDSSAPSSNEKRFRFFPSGIPIKGKTEDNMVIKAFNLLATEKQIPPIDIYLLKKIPFGAGLGGGSSNAAFMLKLLNATFALGYSDDHLRDFATQLGADCAFFIKNKPAYAFGIGNELEEIDLCLDAYYWALVKPPFNVSTKDAYAMITPHRPEITLKEIVKKPVSEWKNRMKNDFEIPVFKKYPQLCSIKEKLYEQGAVYASMSGSGSTLFGLFEKPPQLENIFPDCFVWTDVDC
jgi:4-diphosphocytidyl-2-C-methyl-D-erythritol kinase